MAVIYSTLNESPRNVGGTYENLVFMIKGLENGSKHSSPRTSHFCVGGGDIVLLRTLKDLDQTPEACPTRHYFNSKTCSG